MSSQWIEIDGEVVAAIKASAEAFVDSPNAVLRRLLGLKEGDRPTCSVSQFSENPPSPVDRRGRPDARDALPEGEYELPIAKVLAEAGGRAPGREVMAVVRELLDHRFSAADRVRLQNTEERWRNRLRFCRRRMLERGYVRSDSPRGIWELTEAGRQHLKQLEARLTDREREGAR